MTTTSPVSFDRAAVLERFSRIRARTRALFEVLDESVYYERPIALRNPVVFYEGHLPVFAVNTLIKKGLGGPAIDEHLEEVFARGIDPESEASAVARGNPAWPSRESVLDYAAAADRRIKDAIAHADLDRDDHPLLLRAQALWTILEHEEMHQETLAYMWHQVPHARKQKPAGYVTLPPHHVRPEPIAARVVIPEGDAALGTDLRESAFGWDNERPAHVVSVDAFTIDVYNVTNVEFLEFVDAGGYREPRLWREEDWAWIASEGISHPPFWEGRSGEWRWRGMFESVPLPAAWPVYVTWAEARAFASWRGLRLPSEAEFHRAAFGTPDGGERRYPWGNVLEGTPPANFDFERWDPEPVDAHPEGASAFGVQDLVGNGWEWTGNRVRAVQWVRASRVLSGVSADFFDGEHFVMKGASPLTARALVRRGFRNWFRPRYPFVYATFRCAGPA